MSACVVKHECKSMRARAADGGKSFFAEIDARAVALETRVVALTLTTHAIGHTHLYEWGIVSVIFFILVAVTATHTLTLALGARLCKKTRTRTQEDTGRNFH